MRKFAILAVALIGTTFTSFAQIEVATQELRSNAIATSPINVPEGKYLEIVDFFTSKPRTAAVDDGLGAVLETQPGDGEVGFLRARRFDSVNSAGLSDRTLKFVGPLSLRIQADVGSHVRFYLYYKIRDNVDTSNTSTGQTVVIPEDETGDVEIILESSKDLITWTAANPGVYNAATTENRFFRVRAVRKDP